MLHTPTDYVIIHGRFTKSPEQDLMEVAALRVGGHRRDEYRTFVRCDLPEIPEEQNRTAPSAATVFANLERLYARGTATVVTWAGTAYRLWAHAGRLTGNPFTRTRLVDLQAAAATHLDLKTSDCKSPHNIVRILNLSREPATWSQGALPYARAMQLVLIKLLEAGWTPESTPDAVIDGDDIGAEAEQMRVERWEQIRERQNNLGIERRPIPEVTQAFILLDVEHASVRFERFSHLIEVALVVAHRTEHYGDVTYEPLGEPFTSLVRFQAVGDTTAHAWEITGIDPEEVRMAPPLPEVMDAMVAAAPWDEGVLVTWGPDDARVITQNCVRAGVPSPVTELPLIDLQRAFSRFYELDQQQIALQNAAAHLEIDTSDLDLHRALADTKVTWRVLERMLADGWTPQWRSWHRRQAAANLSR